jgi:hypothetical protein
MGQLDQQLIEKLEEMRLAAGPNGKPLGYQAWAKELGLQAAPLFRFCKGQMRGKRTLGLQNIRTLAQTAEAKKNSGLLFALAEYAIGVEFPGACQHNDCGQC